MMYRTSARVLAVALVAGLAACADSTAPRASLTDAMLTRDVAGDAGDATSQDLAQMTGSESLLGMPMASSGLVSGSSASGCTYSAATGRFACPTVTTPDGMTIDRSYAVFAGGAAQSAYDAAATDSVNFQMSLAGTLTADGRTAWLSHARSMTVSGLAGAETQRTWNGTGTRNDSAHVTNDGVARRTHFQSVDRVANVVYKLPRSTYPYPQSGSITHDVAVTSTVDGSTGTSTRSATRHVVVTFDGTHIAQVTIGTTACTLDLATRATTCQR